MKTRNQTSKSTGAVLLLIFVMASFAVETAFLSKSLQAQTQSPTIVRLISQGTDDAGFRPNGYFSTNANEIYFGECSNGAGIVSGFRFLDIQISNADEITNACIEFNVDGPYSNDIWIKLYGELTTNAATFSNNNMPSDRLLTAQFVEWRLTSAEPWQWDTKRKSPEITPILKEIVSQPGWTAGNAISIIVKNISSARQHRRVYAFEREGIAKSAKLIINAPPPIEYHLYTISPRVWVINFAPLIPSQGNQRLYNVLRWNNPATLNAGYQADIEAISHGLVTNRLVKVIDVDFFPVKTDGFQYTNQDENTPGSYLYAYSANSWHSPDGVDYRAIVRDYDLARKLDAGEVDEVWLHGGPYFGYYESRMAGKGGYWCNSSALERVAASKIFIMMGFNYERGVGEMLHDLGHRAESIMTHVYGSWSADPTHAWNRFTLYDKIRPGAAACGNVHYPPNGTTDYDYGNMSYVWSTHRDWLENFPNLTGQKEWVNATEWGGGDMRAYHKWWFLRMPHVDGANSEYGMTRSNNWWHYIVDFNNYPEAGGGRALGCYTKPSYTTAMYYRMTTNRYDDWAPQINSKGRVVWYGFDGKDYEIYSSYANGFDFIQVTDNNIHDENPTINENDQIVWQAFDGTDYEIFTANAHGTSTIQITNNQTNDWHPDINNLNRLVWDGWDGKDYEIFSCKIDGTELYRLTNNQAVSGYPLEDVWPQINDLGRVIWMGYDGKDWEIYSANFDGTDLLQISANSYDDEYPQINNANQVVWHAYHSNINTEIHSMLATGSSGENILSQNSLEDWYPRINNAGKIVWMAHNGTNWDIYAAQFDGSNLNRITNGPTDHQYPHIDDAGTIAWQGYDGNDWEIFGWIDNIMYQLSDNNVDDRSPHVCNKNVVWHNNSGDSSTSDILSFILTQPVPIELASFDIEVNENSAVLHWTTATETNNFGFEIERGQDNSPLTKIGFMPGHQTTADPHAYEFFDSNLTTGRYYYRLKQIDLDGSFHYSPIVEAAIGVPKTFKLGKNFPNPFNLETIIKFQIPTPSEVTLEIFNLIGQRVRTLIHEHKPAGYYQVIWDGRDMSGNTVAAGLYLYQLKAGNFNGIRKMAIIK